MILDPAIRDWVLVPIMVVMVLVGVLRHYATVLMTPTPPKAKISQLKEIQTLQAIRYLTHHGDHLSGTKFEARKQYLLQLADSFQTTSESSGPQLNMSSMLTDPSQLEMVMGGMKRNVMMVVPQTLIMSWINFFFSGFVLVRLPFPLTLPFKPMLQSGVYCSNMGVEWVSSLSWYFLNLFGLRAVFALILGDDNEAGGANDIKAMSMPTITPTMPGQQQGLATQIRADAENLALHRHSWDLSFVEERVISMYLDA